MIAHYECPTCKARHHLNLNTSASGGGFVCGQGGCTEVIPFDAMNRGARLPAYVGDPNARTACQVAGCR